MAARIVVLGLGPAGPELVTAGTLQRLERADRVVLRTTRHPAACVVAGAESFDPTYESGSGLEQVYRSIVEQVLAMAGAMPDGAELAYVVPGSPMVAERTVELLVARGSSPAPTGAEVAVAVEVVPALSFLDLAWVRLGIDPVAGGVRVVDGQRFGVEAAGERGPMLVAQCDTRSVLSEVKLAIDGGIDPAMAADAKVVVLQRLSLPDEAVFEVAWVDLDREVQPDHLTSLYLPTMQAPVAVEIERFVDLVSTLRRECPWDREQTHASLRRHLLEETYEVLEAIDGLDPAKGLGYGHLEEELGDLLFQVAFHATLAAEQGRFNLADVARNVHDKLWSRHPHVFGEVEVAGADEVAANWEQLKKVEKGRDSVFDGIPAALPALLFALKVQKKAAILGIEEPGDAGYRAIGPDELGDELFALVGRARREGLDPEELLRAATLAYRDRMREGERISGGQPLRPSTP